MIYTIPIHGLIGVVRKGFKTFTLNDFLLHFNNAKQASQIHLDVASDGGYCELADEMEEMLVKSGKLISSSNSGNVASAASRLFMIPESKELREFNPNKGIFLAHNPHGGIDADADTMDMVSKELKKIENDYASFYEKRTGADINVIRALMKQNKPLNEEQIESMGFAKIVKPEYKAVAIINLNKLEMEKKDFDEGIGKLEGMLKKITALLPGKTKPKAIMLSDVEGNELDFGEIQTESEIVVGVKATVGGAPADGDYTLPDGTVYKFTAGTLDEIVPPAEDDMEALKKENEELKAAVEASKKEADDAKVELEASNKKIEEVVEATNTLKKEFTTFKAEASNYKPGKGSPEGEKTERKLTFNIKKDKK